jgi:hypothetical protein
MPGPEAMKLTARLRGLPMALEAMGIIATAVSPRPMVTGLELPAPAIVTTTSKRVVADVLARPMPKSPLVSLKER